MERNQSVDIMRGIAIVVMIMGHIGIGIVAHDNNFSIWYHAWHMPIFYIVSGYFFSRSGDMQTFVGKKTKTLLLPFFFWGLLNIIFNLIGDANWQNARQVIIAALFKKPTDANIDCAGALWFLPALFWTGIIYKQLTQLINNKICFFVITAIIGICGMVAQKHNIFLPFALDAALIGVPFMTFGELLKNCRARVRLKLPYRCVLFFGMLVVTTKLIFYNGEVNFRAGIYGNFALTYINACMGTILLWICSKVVADKFKKGLLKTISDILSSVGMNSIIYLCLNQRIIYFVRPIFSGTFNGTVIRCYTGMFLTLIVVVFVCHILMKVFTESKLLKRFVGK